MALRFNCVFKKKGENASQHVEKQTFIKIVRLHPEEAEPLITTPGPFLPGAAVSISCSALTLLNSVRQLQLPSFTSNAAQLCSPEFHSSASVLRQTERRSVKMTS